MSIGKMSLGLGLLLPLLASAQQPQAVSAGRSTYAQRLVDETVQTHRKLEALELAIDSAGVCKTIAATHAEDVGEKCDADELQPMKTGAPDVEAPTKSDPVYDITQALHDANGALIGAAGMDLKPQPGQDRAAILAAARAILRELEAKIPSKARLFAP